MRSTKSKSKEGTLIRQRSANSLPGTKYKRPRMRRPVQTASHASSMKRGRRSVPKKVTVIIVATNHASQITHLIREVNRLPVEQFFVIVSGSNDQIFWLARTKSKAIVVSHPRPLNWGEATDLGKRLAKSHSLLFLDADTPTTREELITAIANTAVSFRKDLYVTQSSRVEGATLLGTTKTRDSTSIIIPTYNAIKNLKECLGSIHAHTKTHHEIIVVDNGSLDGSIDFCLRKDILLISLPGNAGYVTACNLGMKAARGSEILLLNNDVVVTENWLENMLNCLYSSSATGIVGPLSNYATGVQKMQDACFHDLSTIQYFAAQWNQPNPVAWRKVRRITGLCLLCKQDVTNKIGLLDERFTPGYYEDDDYCYRATSAGFNIMLAGDVFVHHYGSRSFGRVNLQKNRLLKTNRSKFIRKWGFDPSILRREIR